MLWAKRPARLQGNAERGTLVPPHAGPVRRARRLFLRDAAAITPVVGTSLILVITVLGMAGVLFWGTPTLQGIQDRGSVIGMEGEFDKMRRAGLELSVPDASRVPTVVMEDGTLNLEAGTRMMVAVAMDPSNLGCDPSARWWETSPSDLFTVDLDGCRYTTGDILDVGLCGSDCLEVHRVTGSSTIEQTNVAWSKSIGIPEYTAKWDGVTGTAPDFGTGDWLFRFTDSAGTTTYAEVWVLEQKRVTWRLSTSVSDVQLHLEGGAIFEVEDGSFFLHRPASIREDAFGSEDYVLRLTTLLGSETGSAGRGTPEVFLGLVGNHVRTSVSDATQIRYAFHGDISEAWCQSLLLRNSALDTGTAPTRKYTADSSCDDTTPGVVYTVIDAGVRQTFPFEFLHARITSSIRA